MSRQLAPAGGTAITPDEQKQQEITETEIGGYREQDRFLPINNIQRLMKSALPESSKISKDAKECVQECTSEFISFITSEAAERAINEKRKTITGDDILTSLRTLGFDAYADVLLIYLAKYRNLQRSEPPRKKARKNGQEATAGGEAGAVKTEPRDDDEHSSNDSLQDGEQED